MEAKKHGGKRNGAGRKKLPKDQKKVLVSVYPTQSEVKKAGGIRTAKVLALTAIQTA